LIGEDLEEAEINPLFVLPKGRGVKAGDGVVVVKDAVRTNQGAGH
jgi:succinyl-CoA synthetase beta subunit